MVFELFFPLVQGFLVRVDFIHEGGKVFTDFVDVFVSFRNSFSDILPFAKENVSLIVFLLELLGSFIKLNLTGLGRGDFLLQFLLLPGHFNCQFFDLKVELSNFGIILLPVFLEDDVIFLFLLASDSPLFKLFLIPVQFELYLLNFFVGSENPHLNVVESLLIFVDDFVVFLDLIFQSAALSFGDLPQVILRLGFLVFLIDEAFCVKKFLVDISQMFLENLLPLEISFELLVDFLDHPTLFLYQLIQLLVLIVGKLWNVIFILGIIFRVIILILNWFVVAWVFIVFRLGVVVL